MLNETIKKELEAEISSMNLTSVEDIDKSFIQGIKLSGYRLSREEKEGLAFEAVNFGLDLNNYDAVVKSIEFSRKLRREEQELEAKIKQFEKTLGRLCDEDMTGYVHTEDYYEFEVICDGIEYMGASEYAKYWFRTRF